MMRFVLAIILLMTVNGSSILAISPSDIAERHNPFDISQSYPDKFEFTYSFGVRKLNILDTFNDTFTKDLVLDGKATTNLKLTEEEKKEIYDLMVEIGLFQYPETIQGVTIKPEIGYSFEIQVNEEVKRVEWIGDFSDELRHLRFQKLTAFIEEIIRSKEAYQLMPESNGYYQ